MTARLLHAICCASAFIAFSACSNTRTVDRGAVIESDVERMLDQCSRDAPEKAQGIWRPSASEIRRFEARVAADLPRRFNTLGSVAPEERAKLEKFPSGFWREYLGIVRDGRRHIYGNFGPLDRPAAAAAFSGGPTVVCDGGPVYFGVEYDPDHDAATHWGFNRSL